MSEKTRVVELSRPFSLRSSWGAYRYAMHDASFRLRERELVLSARTTEGPGTIHITMRSPTKADVSAWGPAADLFLESAPAMLGEEDDDSDFEPPEMLRRVYAQSVGFRLVKLPCVMHVAIVVITQQRITWQEAKDSLWKMFDRLGEPAPGPAGLLLTPEWSTLARMPLHQYSALGLDRKRSQTMKEVAFVHRRVEETRHMDLTAAKTRLAVIRGLGPWTVGSIAGYVFGDPDAVPVGDYHLKNEVTHFFTGEWRGTDERMLELLEPYKGHRGRIIRLIAKTGVSAPKLGPRAKLGPSPGRRGH